MQNKDLASQHTTQNNEPEWTIGTVNYKSAVYLYWQLRIIYEANDPSNFRIIVIDNSSPHQNQELDDMVKDYVEKYNNIEIVYYAPKTKSASGQHGEGLELVYQMTTTKYLLMHDPDFFFVRMDYLNIFREFLECKEDNVAIGAAYECKVGHGHPEFPSAYGCAYKVESLKKTTGIDFLATVTDEVREESFKKFPAEEGYGYSFDVAWKIRDKCSDLGWTSFSQRLAYELTKCFGQHSFETNPRIYHYQGKAIAFHLFRGTFTGAVTSDHADPQVAIDAKWLHARDQYAKFFYDYLHGNDGVQKWERYYYRVKGFLWHSILKEVRGRVVRTMRKTALGNNIVDLIKKIVMPKYMS